MSETVPTQPTIERLEYWKLAAESFAALLALNKAIAASGLSKRLLNLVYLRASQINGCAYCLDLHTRDALAEGESAGRIGLVAGWREAGAKFTDPERAALAWTETLTRIADAGGAEHADRAAAYSAVRAQFDESQTAHLGMAIASINAFNRIAVGLSKSLPGA